MRRPALRYAIIGTGLMGREHIRNIQLQPDALIAAIVDPVAASRDAALVLAPDAAVFENVADFTARAGIDAIVVASPNHTHRAVLEAVLPLGLPILCEKPLATTLADARWVAERAAEHPAPFQVGMEYRFMPPAAAFIEQVHAGRVGRLRMLAIREHRFPFLPKVGDWNRFARNTGGTMVEKCCHFFDLMRLIVAAEPVRIFCSAGRDVNHMDEVYGDETPDIIDNSYTVVDFANGARAMLDLCMFAEGAAHQEEMSATGDRARLDVRVPPGDLVFQPRGGVPSVEHIAIDPTIAAAGAHHGASYYQHLAFVRAVRGEAPVAVTADDGLRAVAMGIAAETSARERRVVEMRELGF